MTPAGGSGCSYQAEDFGVHLWNSDDFSSDVLPVQNGKPGDRSTLPSGALRSFLDGSLDNTCSVWDCSSCGATPLVTFVTFGTVETVAVVLDGPKAPGWLIDAVKRARWSD